MQKSVPSWMKNKGIINVLVYSGESGVMGVNRVRDKIEGEGQIGLRHV